MTRVEVIVSVELRTDTPTASLSSMSESRRTSSALSAAGASIQSANTPLMSGTLGFLDGGGGAIGSFNPAPGLLNPLVNQTLHFAGLAIDASSGLLYVTNAVGLSVVP